MMARGTQRVVALGGGHGLAVSLRALRRLPVDVTAIVGVVDDGGSSGRLRAELGVIPPGDLRMAVAALAGDDEKAATWERVVQYRFHGDGPLRGHAVGNLILSALWAEVGVVAGLERLGELLDARGRVLPASLVPMSLSARVLPPDDEDAPTVLVTGQAHVARAGGRVVDTMLDPEDPPVCPGAVSSVLAADVVLFGPGSWYTSVLPHLQVPGIREAVARAPGLRVLVLNLDPEAGETAGFAPADYLAVWARRFPDVPLDLVLADQGAGWDLDRLAAAAARLGARLEVEQLAAPPANGGPTLMHDAVLLAAALARHVPVAVSPHGDDCRCEG